MNIKQAKQILVQDLLSKFWYKPVKTVRESIWFNSPFRKETKPSFKVNTNINTRFDFGMGSWWDIIDLVQELKNTDIRWALDILGRSSIVSSPSPAPTQLSVPIENTNGGLLLIEVQTIKYHPLIDYLNSRSITRQVWEKYLLQVIFKNPNWGKAQIALGFKNDAWWYEIRNKLFKGFIGQKKTITSINLEWAIRIMVFEWFFDFLSFCSKFRQTKHQYGFIILNGISGQLDAIKKLNEINPGLVQFFLDNDEAGKRTFENMRQELDIAKIEDCSDVYKGYKDFSEMWGQ